MIDFDVTVYVDVMSAFRGEISGDDIRAQIANRFAEDSWLGDDICAEVEEKYGEEASEKIFKMNFDDLAKFVIFDRDDAELDIAETSECGSGTVAITLHCKFNDERALWEE